MLPGFSQRADLLVRSLLQDCGLAMNFNHFIRGGFGKTLMCIFKIYLFLPLALALKDGGCNAFYEGNDCEKGTYNSGFLVFSDFRPKGGYTGISIAFQMQLWKLFSKWSCIYVRLLCGSKRDTEHAFITICIRTNARAEWHIWLNFRYQPSSTQW